MLKPIRDRQLLISKQLKCNNYIENVNGKQSKKAFTTNDSLILRILGEELDSLKTATKPILKKFIKDNPNSYISLEEYAGSFPDLSIIEPMYNSLGSVVRNTADGKAYYNFLMDRKKLVSGALSCPLMDLQNGLTATISNFAVKTTHLTGLTTDLGILVSMFTKKINRQNKSLVDKFHLLLFIFITYVLGGIVSGVFYNNSQNHTFYLVCFILLVIAFYDFYKLKKVKKLFGKRHAGDRAALGRTSNTDFSGKKTTIQQV